MNIDWGAVINKVPEIAMVIVVIYYALEVQGRHTSATNEMRADWQTFIDEREKSWQEFIRTQEQSFEKVLCEQRLQHAATISNMAEQLRNVATELANLATLTRAHDARTKSSEKTRPRQGGE